MPRTMTLTPEHVALCHREVERVEVFPDGWTAMTDEDYITHSQRLADACSDKDLWIFAYGSLIWKADYDTVEKRLATAYGWHRSFCLEMESWRATKEQPGLMMALARGGRCDGVVYRLPAGNHAQQIERLLRREAPFHQALQSVRWLPVRTDQGPVHALGFWVGPSGQRISHGQSLEAVARVLARACGFAGSCAEYLYNTVHHLEEFGIHDRNLWVLQRLVAREIDEINQTLA